MKDKTTEVETFIDKTFKNFGKTMVVVGVINFALLGFGIWVIIKFMQYFGVV